ncbi:hypothetical protein ACEQ8H_004890 [Pleosporales sp. CAS-2024a]
MASSQGTTTRNTLTSNKAHAQAAKSASNPHPCHDTLDSDETCSPSSSLNDDNYQDQHLQDHHQRSSSAAQQLLSTMVADVRERHDAKKASVLASYSTSVKTTEAAISTLFDAHEDESSAAHEAQLNRLEELLRHKVKVEGALEAKLEALCRSYDAHSRDLEKVFAARIKELK